MTKCFVNKPKKHFSYFSYCIFTFNGIIYRKKIEILVRIVSNLGPDFRRIYLKVKFQ